MRKNASLELIHVAVPAPILTTATIGKQDEEGRGTCQPRRNIAAWSTCATDNVIGHYARDLLSVVMPSKSFIFEDVSNLDVVIQWIEIYLQSIGDSKYGPVLYPLTSDKPRGNGTIYKRFESFMDAVLHADKLLGEPYHVEFRLSTGQLLVMRRSLPGDEFHKIYMPYVLIYGYSENKLVQDQFNILLREHDRKLHSTTRLIAVVRTTHAVTLANGV